MGRKRPGFTHRTVMWLEPGRFASMIASGVAALVFVGIAVAAIAYRAGRLPEEWVPPEQFDARVPLAIAAGAIVIALLCVGSVIVDARRWSIARTVERMSDDPSLVPMLPPRSAAVPRSVAHVVPELTVTILKHRKIRRPPKLRQVTLGTNVFGRPPVRIAFLRLFENQPRVRTFMEGAWREVGYVILLRSAGSVTPAELAEARRHGDVGSLFVGSPAGLEAELASVQHPACARGRRRLTSVGSHTIRVRDRYGSYPVTAVLCHGAFWQHALDLVLDRVNLVVLDLSGFTPANAGTQYELQRVIDRYPIERVVFLADPHSNRRFLTKQIDLAWHRMDAASPNATAIATARVAAVAITDHIVRSSDSDGRTSDVRLAARRRQTRRLAAAAQVRAVRCDQAK